MNGFWERFSRCSEAILPLHDGHDISQGGASVQVSDNGTEVVPVTLDWRIRRLGSRHGDDND